MSKRQHNRHTKRLETVFTAGTMTQRGITSDISEGGIFIRTRYALVPGTVLNMEIHLPGGGISRLKGRVKRSVRTPIATFKNGMGVELTEKDAEFIKLVKAIKSGENSETAPEAGKGHEPQPTHLIIACSNCRAKNKIAREKLSLNPRCGKCGTSLRAEDIV
ncbi:MAG: hypothetical protein EPN94_00935 [Nitrospirae bacterium]|nr:MAG: hypothetical protein EPN94_00935 [Nitrospirota bacterium]